MNSSYMFYLQQRVLKGRSEERAAGGGAVVQA